MRKILLTLTALAGLIGLGAAVPATAAPVPFVQAVQYYHGPGYGHRAAEWRAEEWRERAWRHRAWVRHHEWQEHRWHEDHRGW